MINQDQDDVMRSIELFAGAGGLAMGIELAGFKPLAVVEWDRWACDTIRENQARGFPLVSDWPLVEGDVRGFDSSALPDDVELLAGGPPCQPFSQGGKHRGANDHRDMFPVTVDLIEKLKPKAFIIENVKGLTRASFANYFSYIKHQLEFPEVKCRESEDWTSHLQRLEKYKTSGSRGGLTYELVPRILNAADYGVPQKRERVFLVGFRSDLGIEWNFPKTTHSQEALLLAQWGDGSYWERLRVPKRRRPKLGAKERKMIERISAQELTHETRPWRTVRDALHGLPDPKKGTGIYPDHRFQPGARQYVGHTGSPLDLPAKTLKAGDHGVPGGENMVVLDDGSVRYFTVRESARLQTFPDTFVFHGSWSETMRQLGNAVPVALGHTVAASVASHLAQHLMLKIARENQARPRLRAVGS